ncbi:MAG: hypothetical protein IJ313_11620 [Clostridia bacterium]|nr:hypothetical protein [Clostridia bacterium]
MKRLFTVLLLLCLAFSPALCQTLSLEEMLAAEDALMLDSAMQEDNTKDAAGNPAREDFINRIIATAKTLYDEAGGRAKRAQYSGDIYVCKNFTVHLFRENRAAFRMAEYPDIELVIPNNQKKADCAPYVYGVEWQDVPASDGNPFYAAATFRYDSNLSKEENRQKAREFLMQVQRGDYFQMAAKYYYGTGAHSMIFIEDYDPETDSVRWADSNMKGKSINGERYAYVQYDAVKEIDWFVDAFCRSKYGATIYRLRDDIVYAE